MKLPLAVAAAILLASSAISRADLVIIQAVEGAMQSGQMTIKMKGEKTRADISPQMSSITDGTTGESVMIMHEQKSYLRITAEQTKALMDSVKLQTQPSGADSEKAAKDLPASLKPTGRKQKIGEYQTEEYTCQVGNTNIRYWIARDYPHWPQIQQQMIKSQENSISQILRGRTVSLKDLPGMPVRSEIEFNGQKIAYTVVSVQEQEVNAAEFEVPAGYKEMPMPSFSSGQP